MLTKYLRVGQGPGTSDRQVGPQTPGKSPPGFALERSPVIFAAHAHRLPVAIVDTPCAPWYAKPGPN